MNIAQYQHKARGCIKYTGNTFQVNGKSGTCGQEIEKN